MRSELIRLAQSGEQYVPPVGIAVISIGLGDKDQAFYWLEKALEERNWHLALLKTEPIFRPLHPDPRFEALLAEVGLPR